jgi:hypothetical protein
MCNSSKAGRARLVVESETTRAESRMLQGLRTYKILEPTALDSSSLI